MSINILQPKCSESANNVFACKRGLVVLNGIALAMNVCRAGLMIAITVVLLLSSGCATSNSLARKKSLDCGCNSCELARRNTRETDLPPLTYQGQTNSARQQMTQPLIAITPSAPPMTITETPEVPYPTHTNPPTPATPRCDLPPLTIRASKAPMQDAGARQECAQLKEQTETLRTQMQRLEAHLINERTKQESLQETLASVNTRVGSLSNDLHYWKQEVQRIDAEAEQQHHDDLQSLQTISELISRLPRPSKTAAAAERARY